MQKVPRSFWHAGTPPCMIGEWLTPVPMCVTILNLVTVDQTVFAYVFRRGSQKYRDSACPLKIGGVSEHRETHPSPHRCYGGKFGHSGSNGRCIVTKFNPSCPAFQGHTRLLEPTRISICCLWLSISIAYVPISYRFRDKGRQLQNFINSVHLRPWWGYSPWIF